jgi:hypothetical protein
MPWHLIVRQLAGSAAATFPTTYAARPDLQGWSREMAAGADGERLVAAPGRPPVRPEGRAGADAGRVPGQSRMT